MSLIDDSIWALNQSTSAPRCKLGKGWMMENPENVRISERLREIAFWLRADEAWNEANWIDAAAKEIERLRSLTTWQPMETAPRDGTPILVFDDPRVFPFIVHWGHVGRYTSSPQMWIGHEYGAMPDNGSIRGWLPLPTPPEADT